MEIDCDSPNISCHELNNEASKCIRDGTYGLIGAMWLMGVIGIIANSVTIVVLKRLISVDIERQIMNFILITIALNDIAFQTLFPTLVLWFQAYPEYIEQYDWYRNFTQPHSPTFRRKSALLRNFTVKGRNVLKFSLQPGLMLDSLLLYLLLAYFLWYCAKMKSQFGARRSVGIIEEKQKKFKTLCCSIPPLVTAYSIGVFVLGDIFMLEKPSLFISVALLVGVCVPVFVLNFSRLRSMKRLMKELEELAGNIEEDSEDENDETSVYGDSIQDEKPDERPEILPAEPTGRRPTSEHVRTSYDSDPSSQNEASTSAVVLAPQRRDSRNPNNRLSIGRMQKKLDRMFKKQSLKATNKSLTKSKSQEELESRHNNWRRTALISSLCSVVCVLPSFVYFVVKSTSFFKREYYDHEWVSVCFGYVSFSSFT
ncbi:uncharacterized protein LOC134846002 [Symsagittifera roscoffensis]|uniref:uncharacterized protein LOC134846002 n=1 Tax=Symsagittifera roscoffensis TaxID=84072 RepID=UPI00307C86B5